VNVRFESARRAPINICPTPAHITFRPSTSPASSPCPVHTSLPLPPHPCVSSPAPYSYLCPGRPPSVHVSHSSSTDLQDRVGGQTGNPTPSPSLSPFSSSTSKRVRSRSPSARLPFERVRPPLSLAFAGPTSVSRPRRVVELRDLYGSTSRHWERLCRVHRY
jgi:hypothetical protein